MAKKKKKEPLVVWDVCRIREGGGLDVCMSWKTYVRAVQDACERDEQAGLPDDTHFVKKRVIDW